MPPVMEIASKQSTLQQANKHMFPSNCTPKRNNTEHPVYLKP